MFVTQVNDSEGTKNVRQHKPSTRLQAAPPFQLSSWCKSKKKCGKIDASMLCRTLKGLIFFSIDVSNSSDRLHLKGGSACGLAINSSCEPSKIFACILECPVNWFTEYILKCLLFKSLWMCTIAVCHVFFITALCNVLKFCVIFTGSAITGPVAKECADLWPRIASNAGSIQWNVQNLCHN